MRKIKLDVFCFVFTLQSGIVATIVVFVALLIAMTVLVLYGLLVYYTFDLPNIIGLSTVFLHMLMVIISISLAFKGAYKEDFRYMYWAALFMILALVLYFVASVISFVPSIYKYVCPGDRCPDHVWLQNSYWRNYYFNGHDDDDDRVESTSRESEIYDDRKYEDYDLNSYPELNENTFKPVFPPKNIYPPERYRSGEPTGSPELKSKTKKSKRRRIKNFVTSFDSLTLRPESQKPLNTEVTLRKRHLRNEPLKAPLSQRSASLGYYSEEILRSLKRNVNDYTDTMEVPELFEYDAKHEDYDYEDDGHLFINYSQEKDCLDENDSNQTCKRVRYPFFGVICSATFNVLYHAYLIYVIVVYIAFGNELKEGPLFTTV